MVMYHIHDTHSAALSNKVIYFTLKDYNNTTSMKHIKISLSSQGKQLYYIALFGAHFMHAKFHWQHNIL